MLKQRIEKPEVQPTKGKNVSAINGCHIGSSGWIEPAFDYHIGNEHLFRPHDVTDEELEYRTCATLRAQAPKDARMLELNHIGQEEICEA